MRFDKRERILIGGGNDRAYLELQNEGPFFTFLTSSVVVMKDPMSFVDVVLSVGRSARPTIHPT